MSSVGGGCGVGERGRKWDVEQDCRIFYPARIWSTIHNINYFNGTRETSTSTGRGYGNAMVIQSRIFVGNDSSTSRKRNFRKKKLNLNYFNRYKEFMPCNKSFNITCNLSNEVDCFQQINSVTNNISGYFRLHFWDLLPRHSFLTRGCELYNLVYNNNHLIQVEDRTIANLGTTFYQFLAVWIKKTLPQNRSQKVMHHLKFEKVLYFFHVNHDVIITETKSFNFISCHGVVQHNSVYTSLFSPFDSCVWFTFIVFFVTMCTLL